jgi:hypothetical protein
MRTWVVHRRNDGGLLTNHTPVSAQQSTAARVDVFGLLIPHPTDTSRGVVRLRSDVSDHRVHRGKIRLRHVRTATYLCS